MGHGDTWDAIRAPIAKSEPIHLDSFSSTQYVKLEEISELSVEEQTIGESGESAGELQPRPFPSTNAPMVARFKKGINYISFTEKMLWFQFGLFLKIPVQNIYLQMQQEFEVLIYYLCPCL